MKAIKRHPLATAVLGAAIAQFAVSAPVFGYTELPQGYNNAVVSQPDGATEQASETEKPKSTDAKGKCGEGKCGTTKHLKSGNPKQGFQHKHTMEGKCGEGKCGEGKCGEGRCGADKMHEGKCGEGKCGGTMKQDDATKDKPPTEDKK